MIVFRADGNEYIGYGHVMRCLSLADAFVSRGEKCMFVLAEDKMAERIQNRGHETFVLGTNFCEMEAECSKLCAFLSDQQVRLLIVDSYQVTVTYFEKLKGFAEKIAYVDDLGETAYPIDILLNYNIYAQRIDYAGLYQRAGKALPKLLLGPKYAPLRSGYEDCKAPVIASKVQDICISTGGTDPIGLSKALMEYLLGDAKQTFETSQIRFHFLIGSGNPDRDELIRMADEEANLYTYYDLPEVRSLFTKCDLILSAAGSTLYEICALGVPCITYALADNQLQGERAFEEEGLMLSLGDVRVDENVARNAFESLMELANDPVKRAEMSKKMQTIVDGKGSKSAVFDMMRADLC